MIHFYRCSYKESLKPKYLYVVDDDVEHEYIEDFLDFCEHNSNFFDFDEIPYSEARYVYTEDVSCIIW